MVAFLLYLLESTLCLSILFGVYLLFFRKETFFEFNRAYLLGIMLFALVIPVIHVSVSWKKVEAFESSVLEIQHFKSYYSAIVALTDPDFRFPVNQSSFAEAFEELPDNGGATTDSYQNSTAGSNIITSELSTNPKNTKRIFKWINIIRLIYLTGIALFFFRLVGLFFWLIKTIRNNPCIRQNRFRIVQLQEEIPPFSFFGYVFVNREVYKKTDLDKILAHEITHIRQLHSFDLVLAHGLSILQWFNPLVWQLQKAIKTNHEYLADKQVVDQGHELFDYQSLLLTQLISIRSVELVNNFNLLSIQKRIAMMTKVKSGFKAKLKVLLIVPFAIALFLFFADMTFHSGGRSFSNFISLTNSDEISKFQGIWENLDRQSFGQLLAFESNSISILEDEFTLKEYKASMNSKTISIEMWPGELVDINYDYNQGVLKIWWSDNKYSQYKKTKYINSLNFAIGEVADDLELPVISEYRVVNWPEYFNIIYNGEKLIVGDQEGSLSMVDRMVEKQRSLINKMTLNRTTVKMYIDRNVKMSELDKIIMALRKNGLYKVVYMAHPNKSDESSLFAHCIGRVRKLPPLDAEILSEKKIKAEGIEIISIDATDKNKTPQQLRESLKSKIISIDKYISPIDYDDNTLYSTVNDYDDMVYSVVMEIRNEYSVEKYGSSYSDLSRDDQKNVQKKFPLVIVLRNKDNFPDDFGVKR